MRHFLTLKDFSKTEILEILDLSLEIKQEFLNNRNNAQKPFTNKILGMIFEKPSTRTRVSFEAGAYQLGGNAVVLMGKDTQLGRGEPLKDTARVLSGMVDMLMMRTHEQERLEEIAKYSNIPLINGLSDLYHPVQVMADFMTMIECGIYESQDDFKTKLPKQIAKPIVAYVGDGNNMAHSWLNMAAILGFELRIATPKGFEVKKEIADFATNLNKNIKILDSASEAIKGASVVTTDTWVSMGETDSSKVELEKKKRAEIFKDFCVDENLMKLADKNAIFLHCLPAYRGYEVSEEVFEGAQSKVWQEAHNRLHAQKGIMVWLDKHR